MPVGVAFSVIVGTSLGLMIHMGEQINKAGGAMQRVIGRVTRKSDHDENILPVSHQSTSTPLLQSQYPLPVTYELLRR